MAVVSIIKAPGQASGIHPEGQSRARQVEAVKGRGGEDAAAGSGSAASISRTETEMLSGLQRACKSGDRRLARQTLQHWLRDFGPAGSNRSLLEFAAATGDPDIRNDIYALDSEGFQSADGAENGQGWNGSAFWSRFEAWRTAQAARGRKGPPLTDLYAEANRSAR